MKVNDSNQKNAGQKDKQDPLRHFRNRFYIADENTIYLDGN